MAGAFGLRVVGVFAFGIGVVDDQPEGGTGIADGGVFQHLLVTIAVAECSDWAAANKLMDADRLARSVINEEVVHCLHQHGPGIS